MTLAALWRGARINANCAVNDPPCGAPRSQEEKKWNSNRQATGELPQHGAIRVSPRLSVPRVSALRFQ
jgi:hypothetical protein